MEDTVQEILNRYEERTRKTVFGLSDVTIQLIWTLLAASFTDAKLKFKHLLWTLYFLRKYPTEDEGALFCHTTRKTWRKRVWEVLNLLCTKLKTVSMNYVYSALI